MYGFKVSLGQCKFVFSIGSGCRNPTPPLSKTIPQVGVSKSAWKLLERHLHQFRFEHSGKVWVFQQWSPTWHNHLFLWGVWKESCLGRAAFCWWMPIYLLGCLNLVYLPAPPETLNPNRPAALQPCRMWCWRTSDGWSELFQKMLAAHMHGRRSWGWHQPNKSASSNGFSTCMVLQRGAVPKPVRRGSPCKTGKLKSTAACCCSMFGNKCRLLLMIKGIAFSLMIWWRNWERTLLMGHPVASSIVLFCRGTTQHWVVHFVIFKMFSVFATYMLLRDYHDEANNTLFCMEPMWSHECFSMWADNVPNVSINATSQIAQADSQIEKLGKETRKTMWETDTMKLARDVAVLGRLYADTVKSDSAKRLRRITHLKQQNVLGSNLVTNWMEETCRFVGGIQKDLESSLNKAWNKTSRFSNRCRQAKRLEQW